MQKQGVEGPNSGFHITALATKHSQNTLMKMLKKKKTLTRESEFCKHTEETSELMDDD